VEERRVAQLGQRSFNSAAGSKQQSAFVGNRNPWPGPPTEVLNELVVVLMVV
jgi:hypothetical protein